MRKSFIIKPATLACSAGMLLTACQSERHYQEYPSQSSSTYESDDSWERGSRAQQNINESQEYSSAQSYSDQSSQQVQSRIVIPLHEEQVNISKGTVDAGQVTLRKIVTTETVNEPIQLRRESLIIDREASGAQAASATQRDASQQATAQDQQDQPDTTAESERASTEQNLVDEPAGAASESGAAFQERTYTIQLKKEVPMIQKSVVQTGQVVARKNSETQQQNVQQQVRKEDVQLDKSGADVEIRGNFAGQGISEPSGTERRDSLESKPAESQEPNAIQEPSGTERERLDSGVNESTDTTTGNRAPTKGQGVQDLKQQPEAVEP